MKAVETNLVLSFGFSKRNAEIAIERFHAGKLTKLEEEVINRVQLNPQSDRGFNMENYKTMNRLNLEITNNGGSPVSQGTRYGRKICNR